MAVASIPPAAVVAVPGRAQGSTALIVGGSGDPEELAADLVADQVVRRLAQAPDRAGERAPAPQAAASPRGEIGPAGGELDSDRSARLTSALGGRPLPTQVRRRMETGFGRNLGHVRIHADHESTTLARSMSAAAFTLRNDIYLDTDHVAPDSPGYDRVLAHEIAHTLQSSDKVGRLIRNACRSVSDHPRVDVDADAGVGTVGDAPLVVRRTPPLTGRATQALPRLVTSFFRRSDGEIETLARGFRWGSQVPSAGHVGGPAPGPIPWARLASSWSNHPAAATGRAGPGFALGGRNAGNSVDHQGSVGRAFLERFRRPANSDDSDPSSPAVEPETLLSAFGLRSSGTGPGLLGAMRESLMQSIAASPQDMVTSDGSIDVGPSSGPDRASGRSDSDDSDPLAAAVEPETLLSEFGPRSSGAGPSLAGVAGQNLMASIAVNRQGFVASDGSIDIDPGPASANVPDWLAAAVEPESLLSEFGPRPSGTGDVESSGIPSVAGVLQTFQAIAETQMFAILVSVCPPLEGVQRLVDLAAIRHGGSQRMQASSNAAQAAIHALNGDLVKVVADVASVQANLANSSAAAGAEPAPAYAPSSATQTGEVHGDPAPAPDRSENAIGAYEFVGSLLKFLCSQSPKDAGDMIAAVVRMAGGGEDLQDLAKSLGTFLALLTFVKTILNGGDPPDPADVGGPESGHPFDASGAGGTDMADDLARLGRPAPAPAQAPHPLVQAALAGFLDKAAEWEQGSRDLARNVVIPWLCRSLQAKRLVLPRMPVPAGSGARMRTALRSGTAATAPTNSSGTVVDTQRSNR